MLVYLLVLGLAAGALAREDCCSTEDRNEVQAIWKDVWGAQYTDRRVTIAKAVFNDLFERDPASKELFKSVNVDDLDSPEFRAHCIRVINGLDVAINLLDDPATLNAQLAHYNAQHKERAGVGAKHFREICGSFERVLSRTASCFNANAWKRCFHRIADAISEGLP